MEFVLLEGFWCADFVSRIGRMACFVVLEFRLNIHNGCCMTMKRSKVGKIVLDDLLVLHLGFAKFAQYV